MRWFDPIYNFFLAIFFVAWSIFWISAALLMTLLTLNKNIALVMARKFYAPALIRAARADFRIEPLPPLDFSRPHIFVMNHQSMLDIACAFAGLPTNLRFVAKHTLKYVPFLGWYMWATGMVFVDRSKRVQAINSLAKAGKQIRDGASILAYPEGTRSRNGHILPFKKGVFMLAVESRVPIVPIAIEGSGKVAPSDGFNIQPGRVRMKVGTPIPTEHLSAKDVNALVQQVQHAIVNLHREIGGSGVAPSASREKRVQEEAFLSS